MIDLNYYRCVVETQRDSEILKLELLDLIKEVEEQLQTNVWTNKKPDKPCVFVTRHYDEELNDFVYEIWRLVKTIDMNGDGEKLLWCTKEGKKWDDYSKCNYNEYLILEYL